MTTHPTAERTLQQLREVVGFGHARRFLIHDRDSIFARSLDWLIPLSEPHLRSILREWVGHYNHGRPYMALGPGVHARAVLGGLHHEYLLAPALA